MRFLIFISSLVLVLTSCDSKREALGADNEIRVICSEIDRPVVTKFLSSIFTDTLFTPEPEPYYFLKFSDPETYTDLKSQAYVVVAAIDRDQGNPGVQLVKRMLPESQYAETQFGDPLILAKNVHSLKQLFLVINANSESHLMSYVDEKKNFFRKQFFNQFKERQSRFIFGDDRNKPLEDSLKAEYGWSMKIPWGWEKIKEVPKKNFVWIGNEMPFQWIGISWESGNHITDELTVGNALWEWPKAHYEYIQFNNYKFKLEKVQVGDYAAYRGEGLWETIDVKEAKGGPFRSYIFYNEAKDVTYHINFLIHHPGNDKSIFMRQLDLIVKSFKLHS